MPRQLSAWFRPAFLYLAVLFFLLWTVAPVTWIAVMSVQPEINYVSVPPQLQMADVSLPDTVYYVFALNPKTGAVEWKIETNSLNLSGHLDGIVIKNIMYLSSVTGTVAYQFSEDNLSGETIWKSSSAGLPCFVDKNGKGYHLIESGMQQ